MPDRLVRPVGAPQYPKPVGQGESPLPRNGAVRSPRVGDPRPRDPLIDLTAATFPRCADASFLGAVAETPATRELTQKFPELRRNVVVTSDAVSGPTYPYPCEADWLCDDGGASGSSSIPDLPDAAAPLTNEG